MPCQNELNSQLKALQARVTQTEDDIMAHYVGLSQLSTALAANPYTAGSAAMSALVYNFQPTGMKLMRSLLEAFIPSEIKNTIRLMTLISANGIETALEGAVGKVINTFVDQQLDIFEDLEESLMNQLTGIINDIENIDNAVLNSVNNIAVLPDMTVHPSHYQTEYESLLYQFNNLSVGVASEVSNALARKLNIAKMKHLMISNGISQAVMEAKMALFEARKPIAGLNQTLGEINQVLGFLTVNSDIESCKSAALKLS